MSITEASPDVAMVALDAFPVRAVLGTGASHQQARATIADGRLDVWIDRGGVLERVLSEDVVSVEGAHLDSGLAIGTSSGITVLRRGGGCGCGSRLKAADVLGGRMRRSVRLEEL